MRLLVSCRWEEDLSPAPLRTAGSRALWHHFDYLVGDELGPHLLLLFAVGDEVLDVSGALSVRVVLRRVESRLLSLALSVTDMELFGGRAAHFDLGQW